MKSFRAWAYLQLALNYGAVPFVTDYIDNRTESLRQDYPRKGIQEICDYFLDDLKGLEQVESPNYGSVGGYDSRLFFIPIYFLEGELNLWGGHYRDSLRYATTNISARAMVPTANIPSATTATNGWRSAARCGWLPTISGQVPVLVLQLITIVLQVKP